MTTDKSISNKSVLLSSKNKKDFGDEKIKKSMLKD